MTEAIEEMLKRRIDKSIIVKRISNRRSIKVTAYNGKYYVFTYKRFHDSILTNPPLLYDISEIDKDTFFRMAGLRQPIFSENKAINKYRSIVGILGKVGYKLPDLSEEQFVNKYKEYRMELLQS